MKRGGFSETAEHKTRNDRNHDFPSAQGANPAGREQDIPRKDMTRLRDILEKAKKQFSEQFRENLHALILYGSFATGAARADSDVDFLAVFETIDGDVESRAQKLVKSLAGSKHISLVVASRADVEKETEPLYTAVKLEGRVICGSADLAVSPEPPELKYAEFFRKSAECESSKIRIAEEILISGRSAGVIELCFIAAKHAVQAALAMHGAGYSSKLPVLLPLAERHLGPDIAAAIETLNELYVKAEYRMVPLTHDEVGMAPALARKTFKVYRLFQ